jgi:hypothetical protein|tara:strand:- start:60321 stop:60611 length:291 start_codon:yes stop_codon:yes gene_type:complete
MSEEASYKLPSDKIMQHACKLALVDDKPILLDYWTASCDKKALIGVRDNEEKLLVKSEDEYTSPIAKIFKVEEEFIIVTENSIYIASADIPTKRIS